MFNFLKPKITVATHNGSFHADDVFACATLSIWAEKNGKRIKIIRSRDPEIIERVDIVVDVGNIYDPEKNRFDHHQKGGAGARENNIPYASFGLVWKHYGEKICSKEIAETIDKRLVTPIDAEDNGVNISSPSELGICEYTVGDAIHNIRRGLEGEKALRREFNKCLYFAEDILKGEINTAKLNMEGKKYTLEAIEKQNRPRILILDKYVQWKEAVIDYKNIKFVVTPNRGGLDWNIQTVRDDLSVYGSDRIKFPEEWRGVRDENLTQISGVVGAIFCHKGGFLAGAKTKEAALRLAQKALDML